MKSVSITALKTAIKNDSCIIDVRENFEYNMGHVPTEKNIPLSELEARFQEITPGSYLICQSGHRSMTACDYLASQHIEVINVIGGTSAWDLPLEQ